MLHMPCRIRVIHMVKRRECVTRSTTSEPWLGFPLTEVVYGRVNLLQIIK